MEAKAGNGRLSAPASLRLHWPEYLMEAGESSRRTCFLRAWSPPCYGTPIRPRTGIYAERRGWPRVDGHGNGGYHDRDCGIAMG